MGRLQEFVQPTLPGDFTPRVNAASFLREGARRFTARKGMSYDPSGLADMQADPQMQTRLGQWYDKVSNPVHPDAVVAKSYEALGREVGEQYDYLTKPRTAGGLGVNVEFHPEMDNTKLYADHTAMIKDVSTHRRLKVNQTGSSEADQAIGHPFLTPTMNDQFRAVHDAFGHAATGRSFTRHGEEAAYHSHRQMFSPEAHLALTLETRAQNSSLNFGRNPGQFPEQKVPRPPSWAMQDRRKK